MDALTTLILQPFPRADDHINRSSRNFSILEQIGRMVCLTSGSDRAEETFKNQLNKIFSCRSFEQTSLNSLKGYHSYDPINPTAGWFGSVQETPKELTYTLKQTPIGTITTPTGQTHTATFATKSKYQKAVMAARDFTIEIHFSFDPHVPTD
ncbi:MAG: hypothetical protein ACKO34_00950 [Vampirovibrionales bacterium]